MTSKTRGALLSAIDWFDGRLRNARDHLARQEELEVVQRIAVRSEADDVLAKEMRNLADRARDKEFPKAESVDAVFRRPDTPVA